MGDSHGLQALREGLHLLLREGRAGERVPAGVGAPLPHQRRPRRPERAAEPRDEPRLRDGEPVRHDAAGRRDAVLGRHVRRQAAQPPRARGRGGVHGDALLRSE